MCGDARLRITHSEVRNFPTVDHAHLILSMLPFESRVKKLRGVTGHHLGHIGEKIGWLHRFSHSTPKSSFPLLTKFQYHIEGRMLKFFKNYLINRSHRVVLDNCVSNDAEVLSGVPQGSILGPLLFVLFINDIYDNINENSKISLYADDTKLWRRINSALDCDILQKDIDTLYKWTMTNKMKFHADKCKVLSVANSVPLFVNVLPFSKHSYQLGNTILDYTCCERDLGIYVNERFDWQDYHT